MALTALIFLFPKGLAGQGPGVSGGVAGLAASLEAIADPVQQRRALEELLAPGARPPAPSGACGWWSKELIQ